jgi:hypothetical protein
MTSGRAHTATCAAITRAAQSESVPLLAAAAVFFLAAPAVAGFALKPEPPPAALLGFDADELPAPTARELPGRLDDVVAGLLSLPLPLPLAAALAFPLPFAAATFGDGLLGVARFAELAGAPLSLSLPSPPAAPPASADSS